MLEAFRGSPMHIWRLHVACVGGGGVEIPAGVPGRASPRGRTGPRDIKGLCRDLWDLPRGPVGYITAG